MGASLGEEMGVDLGAGMLAKLVEEVVLKLGDWMRARLVDVMGAKLGEEIERISWKYGSKFRSGTFTKFADRGVGVS
jgi:hypothetical protein